MAPSVERARPLARIAVLLLVGALALPVAALSAETGPDIVPVQPDPPAGDATDRAPDEDGATEAAEEDFSPAAQQFAFATGLYARRLWKEATAEYIRFLEDFPDHPRRATALYRLGRSRFKLGQYARAEARLRRFLAEAPDHASADEATLLLGASRYEQDDDAGVVETLQPFVERIGDSPLLPAASYYLGRALQETGRPDAAAGPLEAALGADAPLRALALYALGEVKAASGRDEDAIARFRAFLKAYPDHRLAPPAKLRLAEALRRTGKEAQALQTYRELAGQNPEETPEARRAHLGLGWIQLRRGNAAAAEATARKALAFEDKSIAPALHYLLGSALLERKQYAEAEAALARTPAASEFGAAAHLQRVWALLGKADLDAAAKAARAYLKRFPDGEGATAQHLLGTALFRKEAYAEAIPAYRAAAGARADSPHREEAAFQLALSHERLGDAKAAAEAYAAFAQRFPRSRSLPAALLGRAEALARLERWKDAIEAFRRVRAHDRASAAQKEQAWLQQAACHFAREEYDEMESCYRSLLKEYPRSASAPEALYWLGWGAQRRQQYEEAVAVYKRFLEKHAGHALAGRARYRLGMSQYQAGREDEAAAVFYGILTDHPETPMAKEELLWLGSHYLQADEPAKAETVYQALLDRQPGPEMVATALYYRAEALRRSAVQSGKEDDWTKAAETFRKLADEDDPRFAMLARFGLGQCLLALDRLDEAAAAFDAVRFPPEDPMRARLDFELGRLAEARDRPDEAVRHYLRVGLLYDEKEIGGEALFRAGRLSEEQNDREKAVVCYEELALDRAGTYGARHGETSSWSAKARKRLAALRAEPDPGPAGDETEADGETNAPGDAPDRPDGES